MLDLDVLRCFVGRFKFCWIIFLFFFVVFLVVFLDFYGGGFPFLRFFLNHLEKSFNFNKKRKIKKKNHSVRSEFMPQHVPRKKNVPKKKKITKKQKTNFLTIFLSSH